MSWHTGGGSSSGHRSPKRIPLDDDVALARIRLTLTTASSCGVGWQSRVYLLYTVLYDVHVLLFCWTQLPRIYSITAAFVPGPVSCDEKKRRWISAVTCRREWDKRNKSCYQLKCRHCE
jgi:hypothetical protein